MSRSGSDLFIVDNSDPDWKVHLYLKEWCELSKAIDIATGYFEVGGLLRLGTYQREAYKNLVEIASACGKRRRSNFPNPTSARSKPPSASRQC